MSAPKPAPRPTPAPRSRRYLEGYVQFNVKLVPEVKRKLKVKAAQENKDMWALAEEILTKATKKW